MLKNERRNRKRTNEGIEIYFDMKFYDSFKLVTGHFRFCLCVCVMKSTYLNWYAFWMVKTEITIGGISLAISCEKKNYCEWNAIDANSNFDSHDSFRFHSVFFVSLLAFLHSHFYAKPQSRMTKTFEYLYGINIFTTTIKWALFSIYVKQTFA